jgi:hypothetical protein
MLSPVGFGEYCYAVDSEAGLDHLDLQSEPQALGPHAFNALLNAPTRFYDSPIQMVTVEN